MAIYDDNGNVAMIVEEEIEETFCEKFFLNPEVWNICSTLFLQDMPFLSMRLYVIFGRNVLNQMLVFFTAKNFIVFLLEIYRLVVIATHTEDDDEDDDSDDDDDDEPSMMKQKSRAQKSRGGSRAGKKGKSGSRAGSRAKRSDSRAKSSAKSDKKSSKKDDKKDDKKDSKKDKKAPSPSPSTVSQDSKDLKPKGLFSAFSKIAEKTKAFSSKKVQPDLVVTDDEGKPQ